MLLFLVCLDFYGFKLLIFRSYLVVPFTMAEIRGTHSIAVKDFVPRNFIRRYFKLTPFPVAVASTWAVSLCTAATIRNKDDITNHFITGPITGAFVASISKFNFSFLSYEPSP